MRRVSTWLCAVVVALAAHTAQADQTPPQRVVSINMCSDELLMRLADQKTIASVTWLSRDDRNANLADVAAQIPANHGIAEEVLAFHPDLVLVGAYSGRSAVQLLKRVGLAVHELAEPTTLDGVRRQIRDLAAELGENARGEAMIAEMDARLARLAARASHPLLETIVLRPNGFTVGKDSLVNELLAAAGLVNVAARLGSADYLQIPLETLALRGAQVLVLKGEGMGTPTLATEALHHPILEGLGHRMKVVSMPPRFWTCPGPAIVDAIQLLIDETSPILVGESR